MCRCNPSLPKETTMTEQFLNDVLENSCGLSMTLKNHAVKKRTRTSGGAGRGKDRGKDTRTCFISEASHLTGLWYSILSLCILLFFLWRK